MVLKTTGFLSLSAVRPTIAKKRRPPPWINDDMRSVLCGYHMFLTVPKRRRSVLLLEGRSSLS